MARMPSNVAEFLSGKRFAVAGVSRDPKQTANLIFQKLRGSGFEAVPVNPHAAVVEGVRCYPNLASISGALDGVIIVTHPRNALDIVGQCAERDVHRVWFHRAFGQGSISSVAVRECHVSADVLRTGGSAAPLHALVVAVGRQGARIETGGVASVLTFPWEQISAWRVTWPSVLDRFVLRNRYSGTQSHPPVSRRENSERYSEISF